MPNFDKPLDIVTGGSSMVQRKIGQAVGLVGKAGAKETGEKASEKMGKLFAPRMLKAAKDGRNTVSASRALEGAKVADGVLSRGPKSGASQLTEQALTARGPAGNQSARYQLAEGARNAKKRNMSELTPFASEKDEIRDKLVRGQDDNAIHVRNALRQERTARIAPNGTGYENPNLNTVSHQNGSINAPASFGGMQGNTFRVNDLRPNTTRSAALLANRSSY